MDCILGIFLRFQFLPRKLTEKLDPKNDSVSKFGSSPLEKGAPHFQVNQPLVGCISWVIWIRLIQVAGNLCQLIGNPGSVMICDTFVIPMTNDW